MLGAAGVMVGTRFWATPEALGHENAKARLVEAGGDDTIRTRIFDIVRNLDWPEQYSGRALANSFSARWHGNERALENAITAERDRYWAAARAGDVSTAVVFAGEGIDLVKDMRPAGEIVAGMADEAERVISRHPGIELG
jgi:nitronate monooxygenase